MKKSFLLIGTATIAFSAAACSSDSEPTPVTAGDGDGDAATGGTVAGGGGKIYLLARNSPEFGPRAVRTRASV